MSYFKSGGDMGEILLTREVRGLCSVRLRTRLAGMGRSDITPYTSAEIPPAGAPSGFDSAAVFDFIA